jgi:threonine aldolase
MRQAGVLAAAGLVALRAMVDRLEEDHRRARLLADGLRGLAGLSLESDPPATNMVFATLTADSGWSREEFISRLAENRILISPSSPDRIRLVTHHGVDDEGIALAVSVIRRCLGGGP